MNKTILIRNIYKVAENQYNFEIDTDGKSLDLTVNYKSLGSILKRVITTLEIDEGEVYPPSLPPIEAEMDFTPTSTMPIGVKINATSTDIIYKVNEYVNDDSILKDVESQTLDKGYNLIKETKPNLLGDIAYLKGRIYDIVDGDTLWVRVSEANNVKHTQGEDEDLVGKDLKIRLAGIECREITDYPNSTDKNLSWLKENGFYESQKKEQLLSMAKDMGYEAKNLVKEVGLNKDATILIDNHPSNNMDMYERLVGIVYIKDVNDISSGHVNLNKSLLSTESNIFKGKGLADSSVYYDSANGEISSIYGVAEWWQYSLEAKEKRDKIKENNKLKSESNSLYDFIEKHNLRLDNNNEIVYNEVYETQIETVKYEVENECTIQDIVDQFTRDNTYYTSNFKIAFENGYENDIGRLSQDLQRGSLIGETIDIPIFKKNNIEDRILLNDKFNNNINDVPADSQSEDYANPVHDDRDRLDRFERKSLSIEEIDDIYDSGYTRIGDCTFSIPPLSIKVDSLSHNKSNSTLRSKSSIQTQSGHSTKIITMDLFFSDLGEVNGIREEDPRLNPLLRSPDQYKQEWYRNGLRPLIAQFKKTPFLPIENNLINDQFGIFSVALKDMNIATVPGFPGVMKATLTMYEFDHTSYMYDQEDMAGAINWKLFRWYYQKSLYENRRESDRTYLKPIETLDSSIAFYILKEEELAQRQETIRELEDAIDPMLYADTNTDPDTQTGKKMLDSEQIKSGKKQKLAFDEWKVRHPKLSYPAMYDGWIFCGIKEDEVDYSDWDEVVKYTKALLDLYSVVYFNGEDLVSKDSLNTPNRSSLYQDIPTNQAEEGKVKAYFVPNGINEVRKFLDKALDRAYLINRNENIMFLPSDEVSFGKVDYDTPYNMYTGGHKVHVNKNWQGIKDRSGGFFLIKPEAIENKIVMPVENISHNMNTDPEPGDSNFNEYTYYLSPSKDTLTINKVLNNGQSALEGIQNYEVEFNEKQDIASATENDIGVERFDIGRDFYVESVSASLSNQLVPIQISSKESPSFQYLGSNDTNIQLSIVTTSKEVVRSFRDLLTKSQRLAREYRIGLTSGILSIENNIMGLIGVQDTLIETISVQTAQDDKESYRITIQMKAFDKEQSKKEALDQEDIGDSIGEDNFYDYSSQAKLDGDFEFAAVDLQLRDAEIYPDMELPTYDELNDTLPYLDIYDLDGSPFTHMYNPSGGKYVDPDFYIRCGLSSRKILADILKNDTPVTYLKDNSGFEAVEVGPKNDANTMPRPDVQFSPETLQWIDENLPKVNMGSVDLATNNMSSEGILAEFQSRKLTPESAKKRGYEDYLYSAENSSTLASGSRLSGLKSFKVEEIEQALVNKIVGEENLDGSLNPFNRLTTSNESSDLKNPAMSVVAKEIEKQVGRFFSGLPYDDDLDDGTNSTSLTYTYGPSRISAPVITQQKIANVVKALFEVESSWTQFEVFENEYIPFLDSYGNLGLSGVNINSGIFNNRAEVVKAAYDWKFNLIKGVEYFASCYNQAINHGGDPGDNPLDWAIGIYKNGLASNSDKPFIDSDIDSSTYYSEVKNTLAIKYGASQSMRNSTPQVLVDEDLVSYSESKKRIDSLYKYLYLATINRGYLDSNNEKDAKILKEKIGQIVNVDKTTLNFVRMIPIVDPKIKKGNNYGGRTQASDYYNVRGKSLKEINTSVDMSSIEDEGHSFYPVMVVDPHAEFMRATGFSTFLPKEKSYGISTDGSVKLIGDNQLQVWLAKHLETRLKNGIDYTEAEIRSKGSRSTPAFDYTSKIVVLKENATQVIAEAYALAKTEGRENDFNVFDINWNKVYSLVDISGQTIGSQEEVKRIGTEINKKEVTGPFLRKESDIVESFRTSFNDMLEYDQKGRLVSAFPTFHMFLIHEGRWMLWHKLWDNFYGYNSITSIDIVKDRRIAADTAVIEMSNIYHNLNTKDETTSFGELDATLLDIVSGNPEDRIKMLKQTFGLPDSEIIRARAENVSSLILKPGARVHLRMGYGSNAYDLPVSFNGTITEMNIDEICTVVAQGDGLELTNKLNVDPDATTDPGMFSSIEEPREVMCQMMTSKGGFFQNLINTMTGGSFYNKHPLGIAHFGNDNVPGELLVPDLISPFPPGSRKYGEAGVNIYSGAGHNSFSQWMYTHGEKKGDSIGWGSTIMGMPWAKGDEPSIQIYLFDKTFWDVSQIYASTCPDYIATPHPFEYRSTFFFGKPHWGIFDKYQYKYEWDTERKYITRKPVAGYRKAYSQTHIYDSNMNIIKNDIKASATNMYTNVMGIYNEPDGEKRTKMVSIDSDIYTQFQRTAVVHMPIQATKFTNYWTQGKYAEAAAASELRDYVKDMYQGELVVMGDPTVKPYDNAYISDDFSDMRGLTEVKRVVHNFSRETGFVTSITPDCISVIDDAQMMSRNIWITSHATGAIATGLGLLNKNRIWQYVLNTPISEALRRYGNNSADFIMRKLLEKRYRKIMDSDDAYKGFKAMDKYADIFDDTKMWKKIIKENISKGNLDEIISGTTSILKSHGYTLDSKTYKALGKTVETLKDIYKNPKLTSELVDTAWDASKILDKTHWFKNKGVIRRTSNFILRNSSKIVKGGAKVGTRVTAESVRAVAWALKQGATKTILPAILIEATLSLITANLIEHYSRFLKNRQALTIMPLIYRGENFVAGIDGHQGSVVGDSPSKVDKFFQGTGFLGTSMSFANFLMGVDVDYDPSRE